MEDENYDKNPGRTIPELREPASVSARHGEHAHTQGSYQADASRTTGRGDLNAAEHPRHSDGAFESSSHAAEARGFLSPISGTPMTTRTRPMIGQGFLPTQVLSSTFSTPSPSDANAHLGKRRRTDLDLDDLSPSSSSRPSKCPTPDPTSLVTHRAVRHGSEASSLLDLDDSEYDAVAMMLGTTSEVEIKNFLREQQQAMEAARLGRLGNDARARQERADEEFARQLQSSIDGDANLSPSAPRRDEELWNLQERDGRFVPQHREEGGSNSSAISPPPSAQHLSQKANTSSITIPGAFPSDVNPSTNDMSQRHEKPAVFGLSGSDDDLEIIDSSQFRENDRRGTSGSQFSTHRPPMTTGLHGSTSLQDIGDPQGSEYVYGGNYWDSTTLGHLDTSEQQSDAAGPYNVGASSSSYSTPSSFGNLANVPQFGNAGGQTPFQADSYPPVLKTYMGWGQDTPDYQRYDYGEYNTGPENTEALKDLLSNIRPDEEENLGAGESERDMTPEGMADTATLYKYQQKGLAWLSKMEEGTSKGSILADDMGLGKTIQAIALMVSRQSTDPRCKTTLIIAPVALVQQWESEIRTKLKRTHALSVFIYHGSKKGSMTWNNLRQYDVVISTYGTLALDYKKKMECEKRQRENPGYQPSSNDRAVLTGNECKFYRCILDEAQNIKNRNTKGALAAHEVSAEYRLCMTGTPMMNNVIELFSLIHFLRIQPYCQWEKFNLDFARPLKTGYARGRQKAMTKLQALCKAVMLRRTKKSRMDGKPLVILPERHMNQDHATFDEDEQAFYSALEAKTQLTFNKFLKAGTVGRNYSNVLTLLLRLRQACCHPHLIRDFAITVEASPEQLLDNARELPQNVVDRLIANAIQDCPVCMDTASNYTIFNPCGHSTCSECFCSLCDTSRNPNATLVESAAKAKFTCHACRSEVDPTKITDYDSFKRIHEPAKAAEEGLEGVEESASEESDSTSDSDSDTSSELSRPRNLNRNKSVASDIDSLDDFIVPDDVPVDKNRDSESSDDDLNSTKPVEASRKSPKERGRRLSRKIIKRELIADDDDDDDDLDITRFVDEGKGAKIEKESPAKVLKEEGDMQDKKSAIVKQDPDDEYMSGYRGGNNPFEKAGGKVAKKDKGRKLKAKKKKNLTAKKTLAQLKKESMRSVAAKKQYFRRLDKEFIPSAKINKCVDIIEGIMSAPEGEKVIVFSQFTSLLDLLEIPVNRRRWNYRRFDGSMTATHRGKAITDFTQDKQTRLLLVSLKAGNAGLNLTAASQVIILDPFWNPYIEEQAIDRAHRIGQRRPVQIHRILVPDTVEDRILKLQEQKRELIEGALDEGASSQIGRLGVRELGFLFGVQT